MSLRIISKQPGTRLFAARILRGLVLLAAAAPAYAGITSCPPAPATSSDPVTPYIGPGNGCSTVDGTFQNFSVGNAYGQTIDGVTFNGSGTVPDVSSSAILLSTSPADSGNIQVVSPGPDFYPTGPNPGTNASTNYCASNSGSGGWCIQGAQQYLTSQVTFAVVLNDPTNTFGVTGLAVSHSSGGGSGTGGANSMLILEVCAGGGSISSCSAGNYEVFRAGVINGNFNQTPFALLANYSSSYTQFEVRETVFLSTDKGSGSYSTLGNLEITEAPEPGAFVLTASALFALTGLALRKRLKRNGQVLLVAAQHLRAILLIYR